ncbi:lysozyme inhibitor LprI family protein [Dyella ginsengisoli]|uniref:lysozyme inhibitor LprI family protein n=1 Tax=Dyella ginsengisoli TaxID=363848 RepID=UPI0003603EA6|nr:lysozyme inhibitor LprI family protein [Dyella ginsengisoli]
MRILQSALLVASGLFSAGLAQASSPPCNGSTPEMQACMGKKLDAANAMLARYLAAAQARIDRDFGSRPNLGAAQTAWVHYRKIECGDVFEYWAQGTYRTIASAECMLRLTRQRTHEVWQAYLTYQDSTPPLLPEPPR